GAAWGVVLGLGAVLAQQPNLVAQLFVARDDHAAVPRPAQVLAGEEREAAEVADRAGALALPLRPNRLGRVLDQPHLALLADVADRGDVAALAVEVDGDHGLGPWR